MRLRVVVFAVLGALVLAVLGIVVAVATMDLGRFKGPLAAQVTRATGRALTFQGEVSLRLFPRPSLSVRDAVLANAPWGSRPDMLRIGALVAEVQLRPLLFERVLHVTRLELRNADLLLETDAQGRHNWDFGRAEAQARNAAPAPAPGEMQTDAGGLPLIDEIVLEDVAITRHDARADRQPQSVLLKTLRINARPDGRLDLAGEAIYRAQSIAFTGDLDLPTGFQSPGGPFVANMVVTLPGAVVKLAGGLADARAGHGLDLSLSAEAEPLKSLDELVDATLPDVKAHFSARLQGDLGATLRASEINLRLGGSDLAGSASFDLAAGRPHVIAELDSNRLDLVEALPPQPDDEPATGAVPGIGAGTAADTATPDGRLFSAAPFDLAALRTLDADLTLRIGVLATGAVPLQRVVLRVVLADGDLALRPYAFSLAGSDVAGDARLDIRTAPPSLMLDAAAQQLDMARLLALAGAPPLLNARGDLVLALRGRGASPREMAASLDGNASLVVGQGTLHGNYIEALGLGALRNLVPQLQRLSDSRLNCAIARFDIARGVATARLLAADAGDLSMVGTGTVNLGAETIALDLAPRVKLGGLGGLVVPVQVRGSLLSPSVTVLSGRGARGNPLSALGTIVLDPGASRTNPCGGLAEVPARLPNPPSAEPGQPGFPNLPGLPNLLRLLPR
ncbi:MAG: AsmA family protein [Acetobacteraceae bacterium]|nr:AsmA family protein [Acetobacteraceae bacterium]